MPASHILFISTDMISGFSHNRTPPGTEPRPHSRQRTQSVGIQRYSQPTDILLSRSNWIILGRGWFTAILRGTLVWALRWSLLKDKIPYLLQWAIGRTWTGHAVNGRLGRRVLLMSRMTLEFSIEAGTDCNLGVSA
jgi:hypothetical protein